MNFDGMDDEDEFVLQSSLVLGDLYPELVRRLSYVDFARSYKINGELDDLAQETARRFLAHCRKKCTIPDNSLAYAVTIAKNLARNNFRVDNKIVLDYTDDDLSQQHAFDPRDIDDEETSYTEEQIEQVRQAIDQLPDMQRRAFDLVNDNPGAKTVDLAARLGIKPDAFRMNADRAMKSGTSRVGG